MKRIVKVILLFLLVWHTAEARSIYETFVSMPDSLCPFLTPQQRLTLVKYAEAQANDSVENLFGGYSSIRVSQENYLTCSVAEGVNYTLLLQADTIVFVQTVCAPLCASQVARYVANWIFIDHIRPASQVLFPLAEVKDGRIYWSDQTPLLLDEEEKKHYAE